MPKGTNSKEMKRIAKGKNASVQWHHGPQSGNSTGGGGGGVGEIHQAQALARQHENRLRLARSENLRRPPTPKKKGNPKKKNKK